MPSAYKLKLSEGQEKELKGLRDQHPKPYVRERAAAILKVGEGQSIRQVALYGLLKGHEPETVREWIDRYLAEGKSGLEIRKGRGRKAAFFPSQPGGNKDGG